jgi:hypothetical protein
MVNPKAPKNVNATTRCARVGFERSGVAAGFVSVGGAVPVTVGFTGSIGYDA